MKSLRIKISFMDSETSCEHGHELEIGLSNEENLSIDKAEQKMLKGTYEVMRKALSIHFEEESKKKRK